jgi:hypothetical protein
VLWAGLLKQGNLDQANNEAQNFDFSVNIVSHGLHSYNNPQFAVLQHARTG